MVQNYKEKNKKSSRLRKKNQQKKLETYKM
jgi:hypothetical protein